MTIDSQTIVSALGLAGAGVLIWVTLNSRVKALEVKVERQEKNEDKNAEKFDAIMDKLEEFKENTSEKFTLMNDNFRDLLREIANYKK